MTADEVCEFTRHSNKGELIVYEDKDGNMHEIYGARRVRADGVPYIILSETYLGFEIKTERGQARNSQRFSMSTTSIISISSNMEKSIEKSIEKRAKEHFPDAFDADLILPAREGYIVNIQRAAYRQGATEQKTIDNKRMDGLLQYLEELEAHYRDLGQYDDGKPIRRAIEYIKEMEE